MPNMTFDQWMSKVDNGLANLLMGLTSEDLPDCDYWSWWDDGLTPKQAIKEALLEASAELLMQDMDEFIAGTGL